MSNLIMDDWTLHQDHTGMATLKCSILLDSDFERILCEQCTPHPEGKE
jgi:hypothetical protein